MSSTWALARLIIFPKCSACARILLNWKGQSTTYKNGLRWDEGTYQGGDPSIRIRAPRAAGDGRYDVEKDGAHIVRTSGPVRTVAPFALAIRIDSRILSRLPWKSKGTLGSVAAATVRKDMIDRHKRTVWLCRKMEKTSGKMITENNIRGYATRDVLYDGCMRKFLTHLRCAA
ncbi:hypothetical protein F4678DRAFT_456678 [Xylaria arbuscula]|nr:hypothetical protein F4678DRAFT_456678 [Xylaria arbuscula]